LECAGTTALCWAVSVWLLFVPLTKGDHRGSQVFSTLPTAENARTAPVPPGCSRRVGPPSPCARFLPGGTHAQFLSQLPLPRRTKRPCPRNVQTQFAFSEAYEELMAAGGEMISRRKSDFASTALVTAGVWSALACCRFGVSILHLSPFSKGIEALRKLRRAFCGRGSEG
jgi:hypothetical protein